MARSEYCRSFVPFTSSEFLVQTQRHEKLALFVEWTNNGHQCEININPLRHLAVLVANSGVHGDEYGAAVVQGQLHPLEHELLDVVSHCVLNGVDLLCHH